MRLGLNHPRPVLGFAATLVLAACFAASARADTFYVATDGVDADDRDGKSVEKAWKSLAFACEQVPEGEHTIELGSGTFVATRAARPKSGIAIVGQGFEGEKATRIVAAGDWALSENPNQGDDVPEDECLIVWRDVENVAIGDLELASDPDHRITAAIAARGVKRGELANLHVHDFRWAGLHLTHSEHLDVHHNKIVNASIEKHRWHNGQIRTRWIKNSEIHHNVILATEGEGYGYKASGHERVRIHHNVIDVLSEFSIESAHELEFGVEIDHNYLTGCISVPKPNQSTDPNTRGCEYTFWIHDNLLTNSYTIEGPRNHLRVSHNYIRIENPNGRVYTHHGGINRGPIWIHNNVIENVDRAFVWMNEGLAENIQVYNNTVFCANAGDRAGALFGAYTSERLNNWVVKNNIFVAPADQPRILMADQRGVPGKITVANNVLVNVESTSKGNRAVAVDALGLESDGDKPWPFYAAVADSMLVDAGEDVGLPFNGEAPDIGAYEFGQEPLPLVVPTLDAEATPPSAAAVSDEVRREPIQPADKQTTDADDAAPKTPAAADEAADDGTPAAGDIESDAEVSQASSEDGPGKAGRPAPNSLAIELVEVDWIEEAKEGGATMYFLAALSVFLLAAIAERLIMLRRNRIAPPGLAAEVLPLFSTGQFDKILDCCRRSRSALGETIAYLVTHRKAQPHMLAAGAGDLGARAIANEEQKLAALAIVAGVAPLLGLLGTMIGMIESFKLVELFGDEGGASLLAGSISKALITTATGLVLAIPALFAHFALKHRTHRIAHDLEEQTERVFNAWFLDRESGDAAEVSIDPAGQEAAGADHATIDPITTAGPS